MKKSVVNTRIFAALAGALAVAMLLMLLMLGGCGGRDGADMTADPAGETVTLEATDGRLTEESALEAVRNYCFGKNPDLESIVSAGDYPVYWETVSSSEDEIVVLYRSYTGAQERFYIDRVSGDTYVTEFVPGITENEERTDEGFNVRDYLSGYNTVPEF